MRRKIRLAWEHTHRELLPALLVLKRLEALGFSTALDHLTRLPRSVDGPSLVLLPFYYDDDEADRFLFRCRRDDVVVNLAYEQMHFACGRSYLLPDGAFARERVTHCAWGPRFRDLLIAHGIAADRVRVTGPLRFDLYNHRSLLFSRETLARAHGLDPARPWLLLPCNFNMAYLTGAQILRLRERKYDLTAEFVAGFARAREAFSALAERLCDALADAEVILRTHPAGYETDAAYRDLARRHPNLKLVAEWDIANWITQAALVVVWNSTSAMEAMVAGTPVVGYEPEPFSERWSYDVNRIVPTFRDPADVIEVARRLPRPGLTYDWALFEQWYAHRDGRNFERLGDLVAELDGRPAATGPMPTSWLATVRRHVTRVGDHVPALGPFLERAVRLGPRMNHPEPPSEALEEALRTRSAGPLREFLR